MGTEEDIGFPADGEGPVRKVTVDSFYMDICAVTNDQFAKFVSATGYKTEAECFNWSFVFHSFLASKVARRAYPGSSRSPLVAGSKWRLLATPRGAWFKYQVP